MAKVRADKQREVTAGHDGTWVAHPALVEIAMTIFDEHMKGPNQVSPSRWRTMIFAEPQYFVRREDVHVTDKQIADPKVPGKVTDQGVRDNIAA